MKKALRITGLSFIVLFLILSVFICAIFINNWDLIKAGYIGIISNPEEIRLELDKSQENMQHNIEKFTGITFREPTEEEQKKIASGEITKEEVFENILNETIEEYINKKENSSENKEGSQNKPSKKTYDQIVADYTSKLYSIKGSYIGKLESLLVQADNEFHALPQKQWTKANRSKIISKYIGVASGYESTCDSEVNSLLSSMEAELKSIGAKTDIVSAMREVYYEEKSLKISYYMSQMK